MTEKSKKIRRAARNSLIGLLVASAIFLVAVVLTAGGLVPVWWIAPPSLALAAATFWSWTARVGAERQAINARLSGEQVQAGGMPPAPQVAVAVVVDFLSAWRFCPLARSANASQGDLEDAAKQLLDALAEADATPTHHHVRVARELLRQAAPAIRKERSTRLDGPLMSVLDALDELEKASIGGDNGGLLFVLDAEQARIVWEFVNRDRRAAANPEERKLLKRLRVFAEDQG